MNASENKTTNNKIPSLTNTHPCQKKKKNLQASHLIEGVSYTAYERALYRE